MVTEGGANPYMQVWGIGRRGYITIMSNIKKQAYDLYEIFGLTPHCTDDELRKAYRSAIFEHHPDRNIHNYEKATKKTQELTSAYTKINKIRSQYNVFIESKVSDFNFKSTAFPSGVDLDAIAKRKREYKDAWEHFNKNPLDSISAISFIHAAFRAEQKHSIHELLRNRVLIDLAPLLLKYFDKRDAGETILKWAETLWEDGLGKEAVQILEDSVDFSSDITELKERLRSMHYAWAQYSDPVTGKQSTPDVKILHLNRIIELGFKYGYIYKYLAEAYHEKNDDKTATRYLLKAYKIDPALSGAKTISRKLGLMEEKPLTKKKTVRKKYQISRPDQVPLPTQIDKLVQLNDWEEIFKYAKPEDYSPKILPKAREILCKIAIELGESNHPGGITILEELLGFRYYWDLTDAAMVSLSKIGNESSLEAFRNFKARNVSEQELLNSCISYLQARIKSKKMISSTHSNLELFSLAQEYFNKNNYAQARLLFESLLNSIQKEDKIYKEIILMLSKSCAKMHDPKKAIAYIRLIYLKLENKERLSIAEDVAGWLWSYLVYQKYSPSNDLFYKLAINIHIEQINTSRKADVVLKYLKSLTRWFELLGTREIIQWIRQVIRNEAPGTWYTDAHNRERYIQNVILSTDMKNSIYLFEKWIKLNVEKKLRMVLDPNYKEENGEDYDYENLQRLEISE